MKIRLNKYLASCGICSRRKADIYIENGDVTINGSVAKLGDMTDPDKDLIKFKGKRVENKESNKYIILNKPENIISSVNDEHGRKTVVDLVGTKERLFPVGRLDYDSSGLILLTNDGDLANKIMHPRFEHEKEYEVKTKSPITKSHLQKLASGVIVDGHMTLPANVKKINNTTFNITLRQGLNRQIRKMCASVGVEVVSLKRIRIATLKLGNLKVGQWRILKKEEILELKDHLKTSS